MSILAIVEKIFPFAYSITGQGNDDALATYLTELPFEIHEYASGQTLNGWQIPHAWQVNKAKIHYNNQVIYDGKLSPLGVGILSPSFTGKLNLSQLKQHLVSDEKLANATLYHWQNLYRPLNTDWAICMPDDQVKQLKEGDYFVELETTQSPSTMKVLDFFLQGKSDETIVINGHNCHPFQANDDISGCAVGIAIMKKLMEMPQCRYSYRLLIAPELHGPMFWLNQSSRENTKKLKACILLKSVGNSANMKLQHSYQGNADIDNAAEQAFSDRYQQFEQGDFRAIYGNDETVFESPPYNIPTISLTRWPFPEYHTDQDTPATLSELHLDDSAALVLDIINRLENNKTYSRCFDGLVCLSAYGLYKSVPQVEEGGVNYASDAGRWNRLMNCLPREIEDKKTAQDLALKYQLPLEEVNDYLELWLKAGLIKEDI